MLLVNNLHEKRITESQNGRDFGKQVRVIFLICTRVARKVHSFSANQTNVIGVSVMLVTAQCYKTVETSCLRVIISGRYASYVRPIVVHFAEFFL